MLKQDWGELSKASSNRSWTKFSGSWLCGHHLLPQRQPGKDLSCPKSCVSQQGWPPPGVEDQLELFPSVTAHLVCCENHDLYLTYQTLNPNLPQDKHGEEKSAQGTTTHLWMGSRPPFNTCYWWDSQNLGKISCNKIWGKYHITPDTPSEAAAGKKHLHSFNLNSVDLFSQLREVTCFHSSLKGVCDLICWAALSTAALSKSHCCFSSRRMTPTEDLVTWDKFRDKYKEKSF